MKNRYTDRQLIFFIGCLILRLCPLCLANSGCWQKSRIEYLNRVMNLLYSATFQAFMYTLQFTICEMPGREQLISIQLHNEEQGNKHGKKHRKRGRTFLGFVGLVFVLTWISGITVFFTDASNNEGKVVHCEDLISHCLLLHFSPVLF